jgi:hypothetical protein
MRTLLGSSFLPFLLASGVSAFFNPLPRSPFQASKLCAYRQAYQYQLDKMTGTVDVNGTQVNINDASRQMTADLKKSQEATAQAQSRLSSLEQQFRAKEKQQDHVR